MSMLTTFDPFFRDFDRLTGGVLGRRGMQPVMMAVDAYRHGDEFVIKFDLPGVDLEALELTVEKNVLSVSTERHWAPEEGDEVLLAERPQGRHSRQLYLSDNLDTGRLDASYDGGVLTVRIPVSEQARPRRVQVSSGDSQQAISTTSTDA